MSSECIVTEYTEETPYSTSQDNFQIPKNNETELEKLIAVLKKGIKDKEPGIKYIKYPELLVVALEELNGMIGLHRIKESAAIQTVRLIENLKAGENSPKMLNTIITGLAGCGKTQTAIKLAKIWFALGFLNSGNTITTTNTTKKNTFFEAPKSSGDMTTLALLVFAWIGTYVIQLMSYAYNKIGLFWLACILGFIILLIFLVYYSDTNGDWIQKYIKTETHTEVTKETLKTASDRDIITVVSRDDFVAGFMGQTASKTKKLLEANIGKVLFIDEAYSLMNDPRDAYGKEILDTLNLFLSENPDKIVVIFAGYKEQMKNTIFLAQPGLERRCMWNFECEIYSADELADIFFLQAKNDKWEINDIDRVKIRRLICQNESAFKDMGGSCQRLVYLSSLEVSRSNLSSISDTLLSDVQEVKSIKEKYLTFEDVERGLISLKENSF